MRTVLALAFSAIMLGAYCGAKAEPSFTGCYAEASAVGNFLSHDRSAAGGAGVGCDIAMRGIVIGASLKADAGTVDGLGAQARAGFLFNPSVLVYGLAELRSQDLKTFDTGQLRLGAGLELYSPIENMALFGELSHAAVGLATASRDDVAVRLGIRYRISLFK
jgi:hypothetical protein